MPADDTVLDTPEPADAAHEPSADAGPHGDAGTGGEVVVDHDGAGDDAAPVDAGEDPAGDAPEDALGEGDEEPDAAAESAVWNETVWTATHLGIEPSDHVTGSTTVTRSYAPYELASVLLALDGLAGVVERAAFAYGDRGVLRHVDVTLRDGSTRLVADLGTRLALVVDDQPAVVAAELGGDALAGVLVTATATSPDAARAAHELIRVAVEVHASQWRKRAVMVNPYVLGLLEGRDPGTDAAPVDDPGGHASDDLRREIIDPLLSWEQVSQVIAGRNVLVTGRVGSGKSAALTWLEQELAGKVTVVRASPRVCLHPDLVRATFDLAGSDAPGLVLIDDLDLAIGGVGAGPGTEAVVELADQLGGLGRRRGVFVVATAGNPAALEPTLGFRSGRFDRRIELGAASLELRRSLLDRVVSRHQPDEEGLLERLVARTTDWTVAEISDLEARAVLDAVRDGQPVDLLHALDPSSQRRGPGARDASTGTYL